MEKGFFVKESKMEIMHDETNKTVIAANPLSFIPTQRFFLKLD